MVHTHKCIGMYDAAYTEATHTCARYVCWHIHRGDAQKYIGMCDGANTEATHRGTQACVMAHTPRQRRYLMQVSQTECCVVQADHTQSVQCTQDLQRQVAAA